MPDSLSPPSEIPLRKFLNLLLQPQAKLVKTEIGILHAHHTVIHTVKHTDPDSHKMPPVLECKEGIRGIRRLQPWFHPLRQIFPIKIFIRVCQKTCTVFRKIAPHLGKHKRRQQTVSVSQNTDIRLWHYNLPESLYRNRFRRFCNTRIFILMHRDPLQIGVGLLPERLLVRLLSLR